MKIDVLANLETLLHHHEEVNLPGIGTLSTRQNDFSIDRKEGMILPASRQVHTLTRINNINNDKLIRFLAHKYGISLEEARQVVDDFAYEYQKTLQGDGIHLPSIGKILKQQSGDIYFEPNNYHNYNIEYFGLPPLKNIHPLNLDKGELAPREEITPVTKQNSYLDIIVNDRPLQMMVPIILLLLISTILTQQYAGNRNRAGIGISSNTTITELPPPKDDKEYQEVFTPVKEEKPAPKVVQQPPSKPKRKPKVEQPIPDMGEKHLIILGVFGNKTNAEKLQVDVFSKGYSADLTEKSNGTYQVGIILKCNKSDVPTHLKKIKQSYSSAWWKR